MDLYESLLAAVDREYDVLRVLKDSGRGRVSLVRHRRSGRRYVFRRFQGDGAVYRKLLPLSCPYLPRIWEAAERGGDTAVLEEYVEGDVLADLLSAGPLSRREAKAVAVQLCAALWVLHSLEAVHRDLKPENVILRGSQAVLIDFDAARVVKEGQTGDTQVLGTTGYAAPEQYGITQSDERADLYALGVLLNIMLTGSHPSRELASGRLGRVVEKCTMTNPNKRYPSALHVMAALGQRGAL